MANEIMIERPVDLDFQPAKLDFTNYDDLKKSVDEFAAKYHGFVFTREDKSVALKARTELKSILDSIESNRKRVKQVYNKPLNAFEQQIKDLTDTINEPLNDIRIGLKEIDGYEKDEREGALNSFLKVLTKDSTITPDDIEIDHRWLNKGNWTDNLKPVKKLTEEIKFAIKNAENEKKQKEDNIRILTEFCKSKNVESAGWIAQLEYKPVTEIMDLINLDLKRQAEIAKEQELKRKEYEAHQSKQQAIKTEPLKVQEVPEMTISNVIQVTGTVEQLQALNTFCIENNIDVKPFYATDDLPF